MYSVQSRDRCIFFRQLQSVSSRNSLKAEIVIFFFRQLQSVSSRTSLKAEIVGLLSVSLCSFDSFWFALSSVRWSRVRAFFFLFQSVRPWTLGRHFQRFISSVLAEIVRLFFASFFRIQPQVITVAALFPSLSWLPYDMYIFVEFLLGSCFLSISQHKVCSCADV